MTSLYTKSIILSCTIAAIASVAAPVVAQQRPPPVVKIAVAKERTVQPIVVLPGTVISRQDTVLTAELDGKLEYIADTGDYGKAGEPLAGIDSKTLEIEVRAARSKVGEILPQLEFYTNEEKRLAKLSADDNASRSLQEQTKAQRDELSGRLQSAKLELERVEDRLGRSLVLAPTDGIVAERHRRPGEYIKNGESLLRYVDISQLEVYIRVPANSVAGLTVGAMVELSAAGQSQKQGRVRVVVPVADGSQLYEVRISYQGSDWPAGLAVRAKVPSAMPRQGIVIPRAALVIRSYGVNVFRVTSDNMVEQIPVKVLYGEGDDVEVQSELQAGDQLVVRGAERLFPGQQVRIDSGRGNGNQQPINKP